MARSTLQPSRGYRWARTVKGPRPGWEAPGGGQGVLTIFSLCCCRISSRFCLFL